MTVEEGAAYGLPGIKRGPVPIPFSPWSLQPAALQPERYLCTTCGALLSATPFSTSTGPQTMASGVGCQERQREPRFSVQLIGWFWPDGQREPVEGLCVNLSLLGCAIRMQAPPSPKIYGPVMIRLDDDSDLFFVDIAAVRWATGQVFGLEFMTLRHQDRRYLTQYLAEVQASKRSQANPTDEKA